MTSLGQNNVLGFQISEYNIILMQKFKTNNDFTNVLFCLVLCEFVSQLVSVFYLGAEVATGAVFHDQIEPVVILESEIEVGNHAVVASYLEHGHFGHCIPCHLFLKNHFFFEDFECENRALIWIICVFLGTYQEDRCNCTTANFVDYLEVLEANFVAQVVVGAAKMNDGAGRLIRIRVIVFILLVLLILVVEIETGILSWALFENRCQVFDRFLGGFVILVGLLLIRR